MKCIKTVCVATVIMFGKNGGHAFTQRRVFCYGDSLTAGTSGFGLYPYSVHLEKGLSNTLVRHLGLPGWTTENLVASLDDGGVGLRAIVKKQAPISLVIILAGTNDLGYFDAERILGNLRCMHDVCWDNGVLKTLAIGIPPSGYQTVDATARRKATLLNQMLKDLSNGESRMEFMEFPFEYVNGGSNWDGDGLHLSRKGYQSLGESLVEPVKSILESLDNNKDV